MTLPLHDLHAKFGARFGELNSVGVVSDYADVGGEYAALRQGVAVLDLSFRGRLCLVGADRVRFLHGQVTNDITKLRPGDGCYAALVTAKGRMQSDLNIFSLAEELLLDFEPGWTGKVIARLEQYIVADDVQVVDAAPHYGLISVQGPLSEHVVRELGWGNEIPIRPFSIKKIPDDDQGELYLANHPRLGKSGFDVFAPLRVLGQVLERLGGAAGTVGGRLCGWTAFETARIEDGIPRFGADMDETNFPQECGIESRAVSYSKGCYIGQEVLNRIRTMGHVNRALRALRLTDGLKSLPAKGDKLFLDGNEVGHITSAAQSPSTKANIALALVRREADLLGKEVTVRSPDGECRVTIVESPLT